MFPEMQGTPVIFKIVAVIVPIIMVCGFGFTFAMIFSPKLRSKLMGQQLKMQKHMLEENKDIIKDIAGLGINSSKEILDENAETLEDIASKKADINAVGVQKMAAAVKKGLAEESVYCKHCGATIDHDSSFCKKCGRKQ